MWGSEGWEEIEKEGDEGIFGKGNLKKRGDRCGARKRVLRAIPFILLGQSFTQYGLISNWAMTSPTQHIEIDKLYNFEY